MLGKTSLKMVSQEVVQTEFSVVHGLTRMHGLTRNEDTRIITIYTTLCGLILYGLICFHSKAFVKRIYIWALVFFWWHRFQKGWIYMYVKHNNYIVIHLLFSGMFHFATLGKMLLSLTLNLVNLDSNEFNSIRVVRRRQCLPGGKRH